MKSKLLEIAILVLSLGVFQTTLLGADFINSEVALKGYEKLITVIEKNFKQTADTLVAIPDPDRQMPDWKMIRALKTKLWLQLLNQIDNARDLNFNFNDPKNGYSANVAPPHFGDSGVDPASIKDPEDRRIYEEAIQEIIRLANRTIMGARQIKIVSSIFMQYKPHWLLYFQRSPLSKITLPLNLTAINVGTGLELVG